MSRDHDDLVEAQYFFDKKCRGHRMKIILDLLYSCIVNTTTKQTFTLESMVSVQMLQQWAWCVRLGPDYTMDHEDGFFFIVWLHGPTSNFHGPIIKKINLQSFWALH